MGQLLYAITYGRQEIGFHMQNMGISIGVAGACALMTHIYPFVIHGRDVKIFNFLFHDSFRGVYDKDFKPWSSVYLRQQRAAASISKETK